MKTATRYPEYRADIIQEQRKCHIRVIGFYTYLNAVIVLPVGVAIATAGRLGVSIERHGKGQLHLGSFASREVRQPVAEHPPQIRHVVGIFHL